ncbi:MAG: hypothetical protein II098_10010 [Treponema sp.]|nr:hypothetical protein [Treponema sp.]
MKDKTCEKIMNEYLMLDKNERVPLKITFHMLKCRKCRKQIKILSLAEKQLAAPLKIQIPVTDSTIENILKKLSPDLHKRILKKTVSTAGWISGGIILFLCLIMLMKFTGELNSRSLFLLCSLMNALIVTVYCTIFVISNIDIFIKKISTKGFVKG